MDGSNGMDDGDDLSSTVDLQSLNSMAPSGSNLKKKTKRPAVPMNELILVCKGCLVKESELALRTINVHAYSMYARGDLEHVNKLFEIFEQLRELRTTIEYELYTVQELEIMKKQIGLLLFSIPKIVTASNNLVCENSHFRFKDVAGYQTILARENTGYLYNYDTSNPKDNALNVARLAQNQMFAALSPNFPVANANLPMYPPRNSKFEQTEPSHILLDFNAVVGSSNIIPEGYDGMTAYVYLRNSKKRLTEAYTISIEPGQDISLDNLSAALFTNVPANEIDSGRIYLVAMLTENIKLNNSSSSSNNGVPNLDYIRRGICAGASDISRIFSRRKGHLDSGEAHQFTMKLYASYRTTQGSDSINIYPGMNPMLAMSLTMANNGWGELIDRIISGSSKGVAINPRAEKLVVSVKELKQEEFVSGIGTFKAIDMLKCPLLPKP
ncbi:unnamed protein product [Ambrosiozyma monospora]|uniref:Unnamed protein product n=1 Tax=Ambrosiozyma monospora TaxID=43982 RepID=A0ACB5TIK0_AMBMO|nr:unnamed protein product [Ambrosiozyma monospora]